MKKKLTGKMFNDEGIKMTLLDILYLIPENTWEWKIYEFDAVGIAPENMSMESFEELVLSMSYGYTIDWDNLKALATSLSDINTCTLAAVISPIDYSSINEDSQNLLAFVSVTDSTNWEVRIN